LTNQKSLVFILTSTLSSNFMVSYARFGQSNIITEGPRCHTVR